MLLKVREQCLLLQQNGGSNVFVTDGYFSLQDDLRSGRPMEIDLAELKHFLESGSDQRTHNILSKLGLVPLEQTKKFVDSSQQLVNLRRNFVGYWNMVMRSGVCVLK